MRTSGGRGPGRAFGLGFAVVGVLAMLSACTSGDGGRHPSYAASSAPGPTASESPLPSATPTGTPRATAVISIAGMDVDGQHASFAGLVTQVAEDGGACRFQLTSASGAQVEVGSTGAANGATTTCPLVQVPAAQLARGSWTVVLNYRSDDVDVASAPVDLEVP